MASQIIRKWPFLRYQNGHVSYFKPLYIFDTFCGVSNVSSAFLCPDEPCRYFILFGMWIVGVGMVLVVGGGMVLIVGGGGQG